MSRFREAAIRVASDPGTCRPFKAAAAVVALALGTAMAPAIAQQAAPQPPTQPPTAQQVAVPKPWSALGRPATPAELRAWDIDVRADFKGLPAGSGSVAKGQVVWEAKCESCHGVFGESNEVFTPIVGGTTPRDIDTGRVANLVRPDYPQRSTMMKLARLSTLWDYINRAMPWNEPKSLTVEEVYAVTAYILHLADVVPSDFTLSDRNMLAVQAKLPNRNGLARFEELWQVRGKGDVQNVACMRDCPVGEGLLSSLPDRARDAHGNLAEQNRIVGPTRGADTTRPAVTGVGTASLAVRTAAASGVGGTAVASVGPGVARGPGTVARDAGCLACHGIGNRIVGPSFREVAERYQGDAGALEKVAGRVRNGAQGAWGAIPMPPQPQLSPEDTVAVVRWILEGAKTSTSKE